MLTGEVELTDEDGKTGIYYFETEGEDPAKDELGSRQQGICEGKVFAPELKKMNLLPSNLRMAVWMITMPMKKAMQSGAQLRK